jgi:hypothetical protein
MKSLFTRRFAAIALALALVACGGTASFEVKGIIQGLVYPGLVLTNNGGNDTTIAPLATTFSFSNKVDYGTTYNVAVKTNPAHQDCKPVNGSDTAGRLASINVGILCTVNAFTIGGTINNLTTDGLVLTNGTAGGTNTSLKAATSFTFGTPVAYGVSYGVTILTQPTGQTCTISNGVGVMGDAAVTNMVVTCV